MIEKYRGKESFPKGLSQKDINKTKNPLGCLILILFGLFWLIAYYPGFLAYRERGYLATAENSARIIQKTLAAYKKNQTDQRYPLNISNWQTLSKLAASQGINLPSRILDAKIKTFRYESVDGTDYLLTIDVDLPDNTSRERFLLVTPNEVIKHKNRP